MGKVRIDFIDLAKGVCIVLIVLGHTGIAVDYPGLTLMRTPLYFALSGLCFKDYGGFMQFLVRKTNKILVPFLFFYICSYAIFYLCNLLFPGLIVSDARGILDVFTQVQYFNGPIWFLLALFWCNIAFCLISLNVRNEVIRAFLVLALFAVGYTVEKMGVFVPCMLDAAMVGMPFFYFGYLLKKSPLLYPSGFDKYNLPVALLLFAVAYFIDITFEPVVHFHDKVISGNLLAMALLARSSVIGLLLLCKVVRWLPVVSYIGRYSIITLCLHHLVYRPLMLVVKKFPYLQGYENFTVALLTIAVCVAAIPFCRRFLPYVTAQKDIFKG
jgi:fucose 4-O-acetylase-like acetyltransferase